MKKIRVNLVILWMTAVAVVLFLPKLALAAPTCVGFTGPIGSTCTLNASATDPEGDQIYYVFSWGDGSSDTRVPASGFVASGTLVSADQTWASVGSFTVRVYAYDEADHQSIASDPVLVNVTNLILSATLTSTSHDPAVWVSNPTAWTNDAGFDYTTFCQAASGYTLRYCRTQVRVYNGSSWSAWANVTGGNPSTTGQTSYSYSGTYTMATAGYGYRFRSTTADTSYSATVISTVVPSSGQIQFDNQSPAALASSPQPNQFGPFTVSATLADYPNPGTSRNSGVTAWDLQYSVNGGTNWTDCAVNLGSAQTSLSFGSGCSPTVTLQPDTTYCFQARARDGVIHPSSPNQGAYFFNSATMCTPYMVDASPNQPNTPSPSSGSIVAPNVSLSWKGGDPDVSDVLTYRVFISQPGAAVAVTPTCTPGVGDCDGVMTNQLPDPNAVVNYGQPQHRTLSAGQVYQWQVVAVDSFNKTNNGPVWTFTVNSLPVISLVGISPNPVDKTGTITWSVNDTDSAQSLNYSLYYSPNQGSTTGATNIISSLTSAGNCTGAANNWSCSYSWDASCIPEIAGQYVVVTASDGAQTVTGGNATTFSIVHTRTLYYPGPNDTSYASVSDGGSVSFPIESGSIETSSSFIRFVGSCSSVTADANAVGNPAVCSSTGPLCSTNPDITLNDLIPDATNVIDFSMQGCVSTQYRVKYNLVTSCGKPFVGVEQGSIYSSGNIRANYAPPEGSYNATYLILGGGTEAQPKVIENFITSPGPIGLDTVNPTFGQLLYPNATQSQQPQIGAFDYFGLTHRLDGTEVQNNQTNSYGQTVMVSSSDTTLGAMLGGSSASLNGRVYYIKGNLTVSQPFQFLNALVATGNGSGLIIVDGNLTVNSDLTYQPAPITGSVIRTLASVGWLVRGNVTVAGGVGQMVGAFYISGTSSGGGIFNSGLSGTQLNVYGAIVAKKLNFDRTYSAAGQPSERVVADGRILLNTPPGFANILQSLPVWQFRTP